MKNRRKIILGLLLLLTVCVLAASLCACSGGKDGADGKDGINGKSAYEIWLDNGHTGTEADFLLWLKGEDGDDGAQGEKGENGQDGKDGVDGTNGVDGKSAYEIWLDNGHTGTEADFLLWLKGEDGNDGAQGERGENGQDGKDGADGQDGANGLSAYEIFLKYYPEYTGTEEQWITELAKGELFRTVTFKMNDTENIVKYVLKGYTLTDIPEVPALPEKIGNTTQWSVTDFTCITENIIAETVYVTEGLQYTLINDQTQYQVTIGNMDSQTEELYIPSEYNGIPVTKIGVSAFRSCSGLTSITIPENVTSIGDSAFKNCTALTEINYNATECADLSYNNYVFYQAGQSGEGITVNIGSNVTNIPVCLFYPYYSGSPKIISVVFADGSVCESIGAYAFYGCSGLTSVIIPNNVNSIGNSAIS